MYDLDVYVVAVFCLGVGLLARTYLVLYWT